MTLQHEETVSARAAWGAELCRSSLLVLKPADLPRVVTLHTRLDLNEKRSPSRCLPAASGCKRQTSGLCWDVGCQVRCSMKRLGCGFQPASRRQDAAARAHGRSSSEGPPSLQSSFSHESAWAASLVTKMGLRAGHSCSPKVPAY